MTVEANDGATSDGEAAPRLEQPQRGQGTRRAGPSLLWSGVMLGSLGCASADAPPRPALVLQFAALSSLGCVPSPNGRSSLPDDIATLAVAVRVPNVAPRVERIGRAALLKAGQWALADVPADTPLAVEVWGCTGAKGLAWAGVTRGVVVPLQAEATTQVFLAPTAALGCTGSDAKSVSAGASDHLQEARSLASAASLDGGDVLVAGGIGAWSAKDKRGVATRSTEVFDHRVGAFRPGPQLQSARIWHHALALDASRALVVGGVTSVAQVGSTAWPMPLLAPQKPTDAVPMFPAEIVDVAAGTATASGVAPGAAAVAMSSVVAWDDGWLFAGGVDAAGVPSKVVTILQGRADIAAGGPGAATTLALQVGRVRPALVRLENGAVLAWGGQTSGKAADAAELLGKGAKAFAPVTLQGDAALLALDPLATIAAQAVSLGVVAGVETVLVVGGVPAQSLTAAQAPTLALRVTLDTGAITVHAVETGATKIFGGIAGNAIGLGHGEALLTAGLVALSGGAPCAVGAAECIGDQAWRVTLAGPPAAMGAVQLAVEAVAALGGPRFGVAVARAPAGWLLVGGQRTIVDGAVEGSAALDGTGRVLARLPDDPQLGARCP